MDEYEDYASSSSSSNKTVIIVVCVIGGVLVALLIAVGALIYFAANAVKPMAEMAQQMVNDMQRSQQAAERFLDDLRAGHVQAAYNSTTEAFRKRLTRDEFVKLVEKLPGLRQQPPQFLGPDMNPQAGPFAAFYRYRYRVAGRDGKEAAELTLSVAKENDALRVDSFVVLQAVNP